MSVCVTTLHSIVTGNLRDESSLNCTFFTVVVVVVVVVVVGVVVGVVTVIPC